MIGKILKSGSFGSKVDYVTREKHDKEYSLPTLGRYSEAMVCWVRNAVR